MAGYPGFLEKSPFLMGKSTILMAIFNSFFYVYQAGYPGSRASEQDAGDQQTWNHDQWAWATNIYGYCINGNSRILKWRYVSTICLAIFCGDIPLHKPEQ